MHALGPTVPTCKFMYSGTSDNGRSEKRTTSVQQTDSMARIEFSIALILN